MDNIWIYEAIEKVVDLYKKYDDEVCPANVKIVKAIYTNGWKLDCPDILEVISLM